MIKRKVAAAMFGGGSVVVAIVMGVAAAQEYTVVEPSRCPYGVESDASCPYQGAEMKGCTRSGQGEARAMDRV